MKKNSKKIHYIIISIILSLLVHIFILSLFENIRIKQKYISGSEERERSRIITFTETNIINLKTPQKIEKEIPIPEPSSKSVTSPLRARSKIKPVLFTANKTAPIPSPAILPPSTHKLTATQKMPFQPKIIQFDGDKLTEKELKFNHLIIPKTTREKLNIPLKYNDKSTTNTVLADTSYPLVKKIPLRFRVTPPKINHYKEPPLTTESKLIALEKSIPIDPYLKIQLYKTPEPNGDGYFKINITTNKNADRFKSFNRDIIFLVDISGSIYNKQLTEFVKGVTLSLINLDPKDRFEIVAFNDSPVALFGKMEAPTKENIKKAVVYLNKLQQSGSTNLYKALEPYIGSNYKTKGRPLLIFILSDGKLNSGEIIDSRNFINTISNKNHQIASIFTFTNANKSNTFLLDLLAYRNRGGFTTTETMNNSSKSFKENNYSTGRIILKNLNYQISSSLSSKTFPKKLPNLYMDRTISLFGQYQANTDKVSLRITGTDKNGIKHELIYSESLSRALKSSELLATEWALQYIFHLYSTLTAQYSEKTKQKIYSIARKHSIPTNYLNKYLLRN